MHKARETVTMSRSRKLLFNLILIFILWLLLDTFTYVSLKKIQQKYFVFYQFTIPTEEQIEVFYKRGFQPRWGWDIPKEKQGNLGNRKSREYETKPVYKMKVFGDSFAYGSEVGDHETFELYIFMYYGSKYRKMYEYLAGILSVRL